MRAVIQRVANASVEIEGEIKSRIEKGILVFVAIENSDTKEDATWLAKKIANLRIFDDEEGVMNRSVIDIGGDILAVSQFTLYASTKKGNRPSYIRASKPEISFPLYDTFCKEAESFIRREVKKGVFGADMKIKLLNDGPVTILIDTKNKE